MLTIIVAAGLLPLVFITAEAADYSDYKYVTAITDSTGETNVYVSTEPAHVWSEDSGSYEAYGICVIAPSVLVNPVLPPVLHIVYNDSLQAWVTQEILTGTAGSSSLYILGTSTRRTSSYPRVRLSGSTAPAKVVTNASWNAGERSFPQSFSSDLTQLPQGLSMDVIEDIVNAQINTSTSVGQSAQTIINNTTNQYNLYLSGDIDSVAMQQNVDANIDTLSNLTPGTLLDAMQINNGLTYNQAIQDQLLNTVSGNVQTMIQGYVNTINTAVSNYQSGTVSQAETVQTIQKQIDNLNQMITNGTAATTADISAVNAAVNAADGALDSVTGYKDLDPSVSDKMRQSDAQELALLDEMQTTMEQQQIQNPLQDSETVADAVEVRDTIADIWVNKYMVLLTTMFGMLVVVCIILKTRYRMM